MSIRSGNRSWATALVAATVTVVATVAATLVAVPAQAAAYFFKPGHPAHFRYSGGSEGCTGGYAIRGTEGMFILTAAHCGSGRDIDGVVGDQVWGATRQFGNLAFTRSCGSLCGIDTALVRMVPGDDAYQIVVDPVTLRSPGTGRVVGIYPKAAFRYGDFGTVVGKMGITTGWTEGELQHTVMYRGMIAYCSTARTSRGDSGGPVWRTDGAGNVLAVGITVAHYETTNIGCFYAIQDLLDNWGAWLPMFPRTAPTLGPPIGPATTLPMRSSEGLVPA